MRGYLKDVNEPFIESFDDQLQRPVNNEDIYRLTHVMGQFGGLHRLLDRFSCLIDILKEEHYLFFVVVLLSSAAAHIVHESVDESSSIFHFWIECHQAAIGCSKTMLEGGFTRFIALGFRSHISGFINAL